MSAFIVVGRNSVSFKTWIVLKWRWNSHPAHGRIQSKTAWHYSSSKTTYLGIRCRPHYKEEDNYWLSAMGWNAAEACSQDKEHDFVVCMFVQRNFTLKKKKKGFTNFITQRKGLQQGFLTSSIPLLLLGVRESCSLRYGASSTSNSAQPGRCMGSLLRVQSYGWNKVSSHLVVIGSSLNQLVALAASYKLTISQQCE